MTKKWAVYIGFFILLFGGYYLFIFLQNDLSFSNLPVINNNIQPFSFTSQDGKKITERDIDGKVYVTEYFFTTCKGICPKMNVNMRRVFDAFSVEKDFMILSHTCMPETDSVPVLKKYEAKMLAGKIEKNTDGTYRIERDTAKPTIPANPNWYFVTGDKSALYSMARHSYLVDNNKPDTTAKMEDQFIHTQFFALVDKQRRLRGIYDGLKEEEIQKLLKDIKTLLKESYQNRSLKGF